jgi:hypothetical protein
VTTRPSSGFQFVKDEELHLPGIRSVVFLGDVGCTPDFEASKAPLGEILEIDTDLFVILGDLTFLGTEEEFAEVLAFCNERVSVPIFSLCGNHDVRNFSRILGRATYALVLDEFVILALDNAQGTFREESLDLVESMLRRHVDKRLLITFHVPPPSAFRHGAMRREEWDRLRAVSDECRDRVEAVLTGHIHAFQEYFLDGYRVFISGGGGAYLYELEQDPLKSHHAIRMGFAKDGAADIEVIPVGASDTES